MSLLCGSTLKKLQGLLYSLHLELETFGIDLIMDNFSRNM